MERITNLGQLISCGNTEGRRMAAEIIDAGMAAGNPYNNVKRLVRMEGEQLIFDNPLMILEGDPKTGPASYNLCEVDRVFIFAIGKGIQYPIKAVEEVLGDRINGGLVLAKHGDDKILEHVPVRFGGHPIPDQDAVDACREMMELIKSLKLTNNDLVITAMGSGVGSLCTLPASGISLRDVEKYNYLCQIDRGMPTMELTQIRNQIDEIKGGRFTKAIQPARMVNLISGINLGSKSYDEAVNHNNWLHSLPDVTTPESAIAAAKRYDVWDELPESIRKKLLSNGNKSDTLSPEEFRSYDIRVFCTVPKEYTALPVAMNKASSLGFTPYVMAEKTDCEPKDIGKFMAQIALHCEEKNQPFTPPAALFITGELITTVQGEAGIGGRNQEFCLAASTVIEGSDRIVIAAVDTDGTDGPGGDFSPDATEKGVTVLAGGIVDGYTATEAKKKGVDLFDHIKRHDSSAALWALDSGIVAKQNISVGDLQVILIMS